MVVLFVRGNRVGTLEDPKLLAQLLERGESVEFRTDSGKDLGRFVPTEPICPWEPELSREDISQRCQQPGKPLSEILQRLGAE